MQSKDADRACLPAIEKLTQYEFKWDEKVSESKFAEYRWHNKGGRTLTFLGDKLLLQNIYGAFVRMTYECDYDPLDSKVLAVRLYPGRLAPQQVAPSRP